MSVEAEVAAAITRELLDKVVSKPGQKLCTVIGDYLGINQRAIVRRAKALSLAKAIETRAEAKAILETAKAESAARIIQAEGDVEVSVIQERGEIKKRGLAERAKQTQNRKALFEQKNQEQIAGKALIVLPEQATEEIPDPDWVYRFFDNCKGVSNEEMQTVWARILANEVARPGKFSTLTLEVVKTMTRREANLFSTLCSQIFMVNGFPIPFGHVVCQSVPKVAKAFTYLNLHDEEFHHLLSYGLVNRWDRPHPLAMFKAKRLDSIIPQMVMKSVIEYFGDGFSVEPNMAECLKYEALHPETFTIHFDAIEVTLSTVGRELVPIANPTPDPCVFRTLKDHLSSSPWFDVKPLTNL